MASPSTTYLHAQITKMSKTIESLNDKNDKMSKTIESLNDKVSQQQEKIERLESQQKAQALLQEKAGSDFEQYAVCDVEATQYKENGDAVTLMPGVPSCKLKNDHGKAAGDAKKKEKADAHNAACKTMGCKGCGGSDVKAM